MDILTTYCHFIHICAGLLQVKNRQEITGKIFMEEYLEEIQPLLEIC